MPYERRAGGAAPGPAPVAAAYASALVIAVLAFESPLVLGALTIAIVGACVLARTGRVLAWVALFAVWVTAQALTGLARRPLPIGG